jgi:5'-3' exonuclease
MGATRLMVLLAGISKLVKLGKQCRAQRVGVDLFGWLHQEAVTHYDSLVVQRPLDYHPVVQAIVDRARNYLGHGIHPLFVLDGRRLPGKGGTDAERAKKRLLASQAIDEALDQLTQAERDAVEAGEQDIEVDAKTLKAAVAVDDGLVTAVICGLREAGLAYVKAPFEADQQLVALDRKDVVQYVETVDSDLLVGRCRRVLTKVHAETLSATLYEAADITKPVHDRDPTSEQPLLKLTRRWGLRILLLYACLAGCDYCKLKGYGPKTALKILQGLNAGRASTVTVATVYNKAVALHRQCTLARSKKTSSVTVGSASCWLIRLLGPL